MANTIAAYSGGGLPAAIGLIRISGNTAFEIFDSIFKRKNAMPLNRCTPGRLYMGTLHSAKGKEIDLCLGSFFRAPKSYTGENLCEIYCHGSAAIVAAALEHCYTLDARPAEAGEFTRRAFLNGKMDLIEAEAVADLIHSTSSLSAEAAVHHLRGAVNSKLAPIREEIGALLAHFYAVCDYPDEDLDPFHLDKASHILGQASHRLAALAKSHEQGKIVRNGVPVALVGRPNVGKSTLFNALSGLSRAIVTEEAGTTRDVIDQVISAKGIPIRLFDTAGIRTPQGKAEEMGIQKTCETAAEAAAVLWVVDGELKEEDFNACDLALEIPQRAIVINKADLQQSLSLPPALLEKFPHVFTLSARDETGLDPLINWLASLLPCTTGDVVITSARQAALLSHAASDLAQAAQSCTNGTTADAFLSDAERALNTLGQITGQTANADIAEEIFSRFCVGK